MLAKRSSLIQAYLAILLLAMALAMFGFTKSRAAKVGLPHPISLDMTSWRQFLVAVSPSSVSGKVAFETWASDQDIYVQNPCATPSSTGCNRPAWSSAESLDAPKPLQLSALRLSHLGLTAGMNGRDVSIIGPAQGCAAPTISIAPNGAAANSGFPAAPACVGEEVRRDRTSFSFLVRSGLWSRAGLTAYYNTGKAVAFPTNSLEIKADWIPVSDLATWLKQPVSFITQHFYTAASSIHGTSTTYAMTSMHLSVKAPGFPDWIWANFENAYTPGRCDQTGCTDLFGAQLAHVAAKSVGWQQYGACAKTAGLNTMMGNAKVAPVFANYCLTGTQTGFGATSNPTLLGSPIIESLNANVRLASSSCISCHAGASFNATSIGPVGNPTGPHAPPAGYRANDFMWGLLLAQK